MVDKRKDVYVRVKDAKGNEFVCPLAALKDIREASEDELESCVDDATVGRYPGNLDIVEPD